MNPPFTWQTRLNYAWCTPLPQFPRKPLAAALLPPEATGVKMDIETQEVGGGGSDYFYFQTDVDMEDKKGQENFPGTVFPQVHFSMA